MIDEPLVAEVCCFKEDRYRWFKLPAPMTKRDAFRWATDNIGMPAENYRRAPAAAHEAGQGTEGPTS